MTYHLVFDKFPSPEGSRFIELEDSTGHSISAGEWKQRKDGYVELVLPDPAVWQDIATAPRDGTPILAFGPEPAHNPDYVARETFWRFYGKGSIAYEQYQKGEAPSGAWDWGEPIHNWASSWKPTHWMPLPSPPKPLSYEGEQS